jgi:hypothetical protein
MTDSKLTALPIAASGGSLADRAGRLLRSPGGLIGLAIVLIVIGGAFSWNWLVALGAAPLLLGVAPCLIMCALGLCMVGMGNRSSGISAAGSSEGASLSQSGSVSCCSRPQGPDRLPANVAKE